MDFAALPPEINSGLMYAGDGPGSLLAAAAGWDGAGGEMQSVAISYQSVVTGLTNESWSGPSAVSMAAAVAPYVAWMTATAAQCKQAGAQARAAVAAYEAAFAATVPPSAVAANRAQFMALVATNFLGQNTPAIAATDALYGEMWAQDAAAMYGYSGSAAAATQLTPFAAPKQTTNPAGQAGQAAAVTQTTATSVQNTAAQSMSAVPQALQSLTAPTLAGTAEAAPLQATELGTLLALLPTATLSHVPSRVISFVNFFTRLAAQPTTNSIKDTVDRIALVTGASEAELEPDTGGGGPNLHWPNLHIPGWLKLLPGLHAAHAPAVTAGMGGAPLVGSMSVPQAWTETAPPPAVQTVSHEVPDPGLSAAPTVEVGGHQEMLLGEIALASMAGRAVTRTVGRGDATYTITVTKNPPKKQADS
jgi:PPE-repeat protein